MSIIYVMPTLWWGKQPPLYITFWENISLYKEYTTVKVQSSCETENAVQLEVTFTIWTLVLLI